MTDIPVSHPRYKSIIVREKLVKAYTNNLLNDEDLIDFGKEEAVDYFLGEKTTKMAYKSYILSISSSILAKKPALVLDNISCILAEDTIGKFAKPTAPVSPFIDTCHDRVKKIRFFWGDRLLIGFNKNNFDERLLNRINIPYFEYATIDDLLDLGIDLLFYHKRDRHLERLKNTKKIYFGLNLFSKDYSYADIIVFDNITRFFTNLENLYFRLIKKDKEMISKMITRYNNVCFLKEYIKEMIVHTEKRLNDTILY